MELNNLGCEMVEKALSLGAFKAAVIPVSDVKTDPHFRTLCEKNLCGKYGRCWTCPPDAGDINELIARIHKFEYAFVYQTVSELEDSFDIEGMAEAATRHNELMQTFLVTYTPDTVGCPVLHLGAGGCHVCERCAKIDNQPCRYPEKAISSLETYGINVSELAKSSGMKYINGQDTVTYFGAVLFGVKKG